MGKHTTQSELSSVKINEIERSIDWARVFIGSLLYFLAVAFSIIIMLVYKILQLPSATKYICGEPAELACYLYVMDQVITTTQWQSIQFIVYFIISLMLWPMFKNAKGKVLLNLGLVSCIVSSLFFFTIEHSGPELIASASCPLFVALLILRYRKRKIVFNSLETH